MSLVGKYQRFRENDFKTKKMAPALGLEPRTKWLTATYSTIELRRSI